MAGRASDRSVVAVTDTTEFEIMDPANVAMAATGTNNQVSPSGIAMWLVANGFVDGSAQDVDGAKNFTTTPTVPFHAYSSAWNGLKGVPTKNDVYDAIEAISAGSTPDPSKNDLWVYVRDPADGGNDANDGLSDESPVATIAAAQAIFEANVAGLGGGQKALGGVLDIGLGNFEVTSTFPTNRSLRIRGQKMVNAGWHADGNPTPGQFDGTGTVLYAGPGCPDYAFAYEGVGADTDFDDFAHGLIIENLTIRDTGIKILRPGFQTAFYQVKVEDAPGHGFWIDGSAVTFAMRDCSAQRCGHDNSLGSGIYINMGAVAAPIGTSAPALQSLYIDNFQCDSCYDYPVHIFHATSGRACTIAIDGLETENKTGDGADGYHMAAVYIEVDSAATNGFTLDLRNVQAFRDASWPSNGSAGIVKIAGSSGDAKAPRILFRNVKCSGGYAEVIHDDIRSEKYVGTVDGCEVRYGIADGYWDGNDVNAQVRLAAFHNGWYQYYVTKNAGGVEPGITCPSPAIAYYKDSVWLKLDGTWFELAGTGQYTQPAVSQYVISADMPAAFRQAAGNLTNVHVCDGTDDDVEIAAAVAAGPTVLSAGDFYLRTDQVYLDQNGSALYGSGFGRDAAGSHGGRDLTHGTRILPKSGESSGWLIRVQQLLDDGGTPTESTVAHATVRDLHFESSESGVNGLLVHSHEFQVDNIDIEEMAGGTGILFQGQDSGHFVTRWSTYNGRANNLHVNNCDTGIEMGTESADMHGVNWIINDCTTGIHLTGGSSSQFTNIHCYSNTTHVKFEGGGTRSKWVNCKLEHSGEHCIDVVSSGSAKPVDVQWVNVGFNCNGEDTHDTYDVVHVRSAAGTAYRWTWVNVHCGNSDNSANKARYLFNLTTQGREWTIIGGHFGDFGTASDGVLTAGVTGGPSTNEFIHWGNTTVKDELLVASVQGVNDWRGTSVNEHQTIS